MGRIIFNVWQKNRHIEGSIWLIKMSAIWKLKEGDFEYFNCTITDYNID